jgi:hypothetical protein
VDVASRRYEKEGELMRRDYFKFFEDHLVRYVISMEGSEPHEEHVRCAYEFLDIFYMYDEVMF